MTSIPHSISNLLADLWQGSSTGRAGRVFSVTAAAVALALVAVFAVVPADPLAATVQVQSSAQPGQTLVVSDLVVLPPLARDAFAITPGSESFIASGTNQDWARLLLSYGGWPVSDNNVTVIVRWMRQENYINTWWNRNNPLNNGWGSGGGSGLGSYVNLKEAARNAAEALNTLPGYGPIRAAFAASADTAVTESAIWASPWASGHYANGAHWSHAPVPVVKAPAEVW